MDTTSSRMGLRGAVFATLLLATSLGLLVWQDARLAAVYTAEQVERARAVQTLVEGQQRDELVRRGELIAGDAAFSDYVGQALGGALPGVPVDTNSIVDLLAERQQQLELSVTAVMDASGRVIAHSGLKRRDTLDGEPVFERARRGLSLSTGLWIEDRQPLHVAVLPLAALGSSEGFLLVGLPVQRDFAQTIATAGGVDVVLLDASAAGPVVIESTLPASTNPTVQAAARAATPAGAPVMLEVDGATRRGSSSPLLGSGTATLLILPPVDAHGALSRASRIPWLLGTLILALALGLAGWWMSRRVLRPLNVITDLLDRTGAGDFHLQVRDGDAGAMTALAAAFNRMAQNLRR